MAKRAIRPIRIEGNVAYVPLTQGYEAIIDAADVPLVEGRNWCAHRNRRSVYGQTNIRRPDGSWTMLLMHTAITRYPMTDHKDGDGLNNRRSNLREATIAENGRNQRTPINNTSGIKGVTWDKAAGKWLAQIAHGGKGVTVGRYDTIEAARDAVEAKRIDLHGEFARHG